MRADAVVDLFSVDPAEIEVFERRDLGCQFDAGELGFLQRLSHDGFAVIVNYAGNAAQAEHTVAEIAAAGGRSLAIRADVANVTDVERLFKPSSLA